MEYKNLLTMKQPALGKKISELRKQKRFNSRRVSRKM